ncbi:metallophosphatase domain-containing protein [Marinospirillum alkaliphilum]|uniref:Predicted phosphoesterase n=1 Tax=Marinospirillum alkaliphilum DSM 21637 TaxID=1122209 RepID=A0A1K1Y1A2_9GAMM|nr:metallophosphatase domain-containing protein [Marinospirillum alkaliphilum]SFX55518.1 Predicted phosphoesterase [Marinospirillum alkaliphilum DSM 21637]
MRLVLVSDTHGRHEELVLPEGDCLIHAGDFSSGWQLEDVAAFLQWFAGQPHRHKLLIAGNHDRCFEALPEQMLQLIPEGVIYLQDSACELEGIRVWGSPWTPRFFDFSFMLSRGEPLAERWRRIPDDVELLITHGPPHGLADQTSTGEHVGCEDLKQRLQQLPQLRLHVCGHIHEGYGIYPDRSGRHTTVNASSCRWADPGLNPPLVLDF